MHKNWPWKWPHHPNSQSLGPLAGPLADILSVKVENVTLKGQEATSSGKEFVMNVNANEVLLMFEIFSYLLDEGQSEFPDPINEYKGMSCLFLVLFGNQKWWNYRFLKGSFTRPRWDLDEGESEFPGTTIDEFARSHRFLPDQPSSLDRRI